MREKVKFAPTKSKYKVYVIDEVHQLTREAFNALLKTLEEPPSHVIFVLATTEPYKIPKTILSRCQRFDFKRVGIADLIKRLDYIAEQEGLKLDEESKRLLAQTAAGSVRDVESLLDTVLGKGLTTITKKDIEEILGRTELERIEQLYHFLVKKDVSSALSLLNQIIEEGKDLNQFTVDLVEFLREKLIKNPSPVLASWIKIIVDAQQKMKTAHITQLPLELAIVEIAYKKEDGEKSNEVKEDDPDPKENPSKQKAQDINQEIDIDWKQVVAQVRPHNHSLCFLFEGSQPLEIQDGQIILGVSFKFHKDKLEEVKNRRLIEEVIKKVTGRELKLACRVVKNLGKAIPEERDLIKEVAEVFEI
uniref:AAA family ATPase n=1 Tax=candidate division CPR3 bacterium TaxID=2268181 RepID=A0A7V3J997_UNCC3